jgi:hypothetical protein
MKFLRIISAVLLALLVLVSSSSFMVGIHRCGGHIKNIALFTKAASCQMEQNLPLCHLHVKAACCEDQTIIHKGEGFKIYLVQAHSYARVVLTIEQPSIFISEIIPSTPASQLKYFNYDPPLRSSDRIINHQVFLI